MITGIGTFDFVSYAQDNVPKGATITVELSEAAAERKPIEGAEIKLISEDGKEYIKKSDDEGKHKFTDIPAGRYTLNITKTGYRDRIGISLVLSEGGEGYQHIKMIKGNIVPHPILVNVKPDTKRLETLIQHISKEIGQLYGLDETTLNNLQKSVMYTVKTKINKDGSLLNQAYSQASAEGNLGLLVLLLVDPDLNASFANYLTETQLQSYIDSKKERRQQVRKAFADIFTLYLDQVLSFSPNQREDITKLLYKWTDWKLYIISNHIFTGSLTQTIVDFLHGSTHGSFKQILTGDQYEIWKEIEKLTKSLNEMLIIERNQFGKKVVVKQKKRKVSIEKLKIENLIERILHTHTKRVHTKRVRTLNDSIAKRFALVNKGIVEQYVEKQNRIVIRRSPFMVTYTELFFSAVTGQIPRNVALQQLKALQKDYWEDSFSNEVEDVDVVADDKLNAMIQAVKQTLLNQTLLENVFNIVTEPIYQQTIKDTISEVEYEEYRKHQIEIETMRQRAAQNLVVEFLDMHILLNPMQRRKIEEIASKLTIPVLNGIGLQFMFLELYLNINPDDLSPWQQNALKQGVFLK